MSMIPVRVEVPDDRRASLIAEIEPGEIRFSYRNKYIFLVVGVALATIFCGPLFALIYPPAVVRRALHAWVCRRHG